MQPRPFSWLVVLGMLLVLLGRSPPAHAEEPGCPAAVRGWLADAALAVGTPIESVDCPYDHIHLRLEPAGAAPLDVDIDRSTAHAFVVAAGVGVSPLLEVDDFSTVLEARREPFERLVVWMRQHPERVTLGHEALEPFVAPSFGRGLPWLLVAGVACALLGRRGVRGSRRDAFVVLALVGVAAVLRLAFGAWGPLRINGLGPLWVMAAAVDPEQVRWYGPGYAEVFGPPVRMLHGAPDTVLYATNAVVSATVPALAFALARAWGIDARRAALAGAVLVLDPASVHTAATESYVPLIAALVLGASLASASASRSALRGERGRAAWFAAAACLLCAQAARVHPAAWIPVALAPLAAGGAPPLCPALARTRLALAAMFLCGATVVATSAPHLLHTYKATLNGQLMRPLWVFPRNGPWLVLAAVALLALARPRAPAVLGALWAAALFATRHNYSQSALWQANLDALYLPVVVVGAVCALPAPWASRPAVLAASTASAVALLALRAPPPWKPTTEHAEYLWARRWLADERPAGCRVMYVTVAGKRNLLLPTYVSPGITSRDVVRLDGGAPLDVRAVLGSIRCTYYVHTSICTTPEGRPVCEAVERELALSPVARESFAPVESNRFLRYDRNVVEDVISHIDGYARASDLAAPP